MSVSRFAALALATGLAVAGCSQSAPQSVQAGLDGPERVMRGQEFVLRASEGWLIAGRAADAQHEDGSLAVLYGEADGSKSPSAVLEHEGQMIHDDVADACVQELRYIFPETAKVGTWKICTAIYTESNGQSEMQSEQVCVQLAVS